MRILITIPHYFRSSTRKGAGTVAHGSLTQAGATRVRALTACLTALHHLFARPQCIYDLSQRTTHPANQKTARGVEIVVCTTRGQHLLDQLALGQDYYQHHPTSAEPLLLGFECQAVLRDRLGSFDYYGFMEDDLLLHDPWFFHKLAWFTGLVGEDCLLQPQRYEVGSDRLVHKAYIDGGLAERVTAPFQNIHETARLHARVLGVDIVLQRTSNPHAGCYFLNAAQMATWARQPHFLDRDASFIGPLESAATLGIMRTFRVYKPAPENASFFEIEHFGQAFLNRLKSPPKE